MMSSDNENNLIKNNLEEIINIDKWYSIKKDITLEENLKNKI